MVRNNGSTATRRITGVAAGSADTDAVNVAQLKKVVSGSSVQYFSVNNTRPRDGSITALLDSISQTANQNNNGASAEGAIAIGVGANSTVDASVAIGYGAKNNSGNGRPSNEKSAIAIGLDAQTTGSDSIALGQSARASGGNAFALGKVSKATANGAVAIGLLANATTENSVALGAASLADRAGNSFGYDPNLFANKTSGNAGAWKSGTYGAISVGKSGYERQIINVAAGSADTDAVNVAQLKNVTMKVTDNKTGRAANTFEKLKLSAGMMKFVGSADISAIASTNSNDVNVTFALQKGAVTSTEEKAVSGKTVYGAVSGARTTVAKGNNESILEVTGGTQGGITAKAYTLSINKEALKREVDSHFVSNTEFSETAVTSKVQKGNLQVDTELEFKDSKNGNARLVGNGDLKIGLSQTVKNQLASIAGKASQTDLTTLQGNWLKVQGETSTQFTRNNNENKTLLIKSGNITSGTGTNNAVIYKGDNLFVAVNTTNNNLLEIGFRQDPTFTKVSIGTNGPVLSSTGLAMANQKISGLANGVDGTDAVNKSQLDTKEDKFTKGNLTVDAKTLKIKTGSGTGRLVGGDVELALADDLVAKINNINTTLSTGKITFSSGANADQDVVLGKKFTLNGSDDITATVAADGANGDAKVDFTLNKITDIAANGASTKVATTAAVKTYVDNQLAAQTIKYKANSTGNGETVKLSDGLDFIAGANLASSVQADGKVTYSLNSTLANISSIANGVGDAGAKITLNATAKEITLNESKIKGLADGSIAANSKEAITGNQLSTLATALGLTDKITNNVFTAPSFTKLKGATGADENAATTLKGAIDNTISALNRGFKVAGTLTKDGSADKTQYLGSTINIKEGTLTKETGFVGKNLKTEYSYNSGNGTVSIGLTETPEFKSVSFKNGDNNTAGTIAVTDDGNVTVQHGANTASKIATEAGFNDLTSTDEIAVTGGGKVFGNETSLSLKAGSIAEAKLASDVTAKLNKKLAIKSGTTTKDDVLGGTLEFAAGSNLTAELDATNSKVTYSLKNTLSGISSIGNDANNQITFGSGDTGSTTIKVGGKDLTLTKSNDKVAITGLATPTDTSSSDTAVNKEYVDNLTGKTANLKIGANLADKAGATGTPDFKHTNAKSISLETQGLNFKKDANNNIEVAVDEKGNITHTLNSTLTNVSSIKKGANNGSLALGDDNASLESAAGKSKLSLTENSATLSAGTDKGQIEVKTGNTDADNKIVFTPKKDKAVTLDHTGKLSGLASGNITTDSTDAISGKQLKDLTGKLGINVANDNITFSTPTFTKTKTVAGADEATAPTSLVEAINKTVEVLNRGIQYGADKYAANSGSDTAKKTQYLGSTVDIKTGNTSTGFVGSNLETKYTYDATTGNGKFEIGLKESPTFKDVTSKTITIKGQNGANGAAGKDAVLGADKDGNLTVINGKDGTNGATGAAGTPSKVLTEGNVNGLAKLKYNANSGANTAKEVALSTGLNFTNGTNTNATIDENGVVKFNLNSTLTGIDVIKKADDQGSLNLTTNSASLESAKDNSSVSLTDKKATISAGKDKGKIEVIASDTDTENKIVFTPKNGKSVTLDNTGKLSGLADASLSDTSTDAVTGKQLQALGATHLGLTVNTAGTGFDAPSFTALKTAAGADGTAATTLKDAIDKTITALNQGFKVAGTLTKDGSTDKTQYLGSTINIKEGTLTKVTGFVGTNLKTEYSYDSGNGTISIGLTETPEFKSVSIKNGTHEVAKLEGTDANGGKLTLKGANGADGVTVDGKDKAITGADTLTASGGTTAKPANKIELANGTGTDKNVAITAGGKTLTIAKDGATGADGVKVTGATQIGKDANNGIKFADGQGADKKAIISVGGKELVLKSTTETVAGDQNPKDLVIISNVATPTDDYDATNKKYVDDKLKASNDKLDDVDANRPFVFMLDEKDDGNPVEVVKGRDGKLYKKADLTNTTYKEGTGYVNADGTAASSLDPHKVKKVTIAARSGETTNDALSVGNVASGLGLAGKYADNAKGTTSKPDAVTVKVAIDKIADLVKDNTTFKGAALNKVATIGDLQAVAISGLNFTGNVGVNVHRKLTETLAIVGNKTLFTKAAEDAKANVLKEMSIDSIPTDDANKATYDTKFAVALAEANKAVTDKFSDKNVITETKDGEVSIKLAKVPEFEGLDIKDPTKDGETVAIRPDGLEVTDANGNTNNIGADGVEVTDANGNINSIGADSITTSDKDGNNTVLGANGVDITDAEGNTNTSTAKENKLADDEGNTSTNTAAESKLADKDGNTNTNTAAESKLADKEGNTNTNTATENKLADKEGNTTSMTAGGVDIADAQGNRNNIDATGLIIADDDTSNVIDKDGMTVTDADGNNSSIGAGGVNIESDKGSSDLTADKLAFTGKDGKDSVAIKAADGTNGPSIDFAKAENGKDGRDGTGKITGLADIDANETDGTIAANKNYVDDKFAEANAGQPFEYYTKEGDEKVVRGRDGKLYKESELANYTFDKDSGEYKAKDGSTGKPTALDSDKVIVKAMPNAKPMAIGNVASALGKTGTDVTAKYGDATSPTNKASAVAKAKELIAGTNGTGGLINQTTDLDKAVTLKDLQATAIAGLTFTGNHGEEVHRPLGTTLSIVGNKTELATLNQALADLKAANPNNAADIAAAAAKIDAFIAKFSDKNLITVTDKEKNEVSIRMAERPEFKGIDIKDPAKAGDTVSIDPDGLEVTDANGNTNNIGADGVEVTDANGNANSIGADGMVVSDADGNNNNLNANGVEITDAEGNTNTSTAKENKLADDEGNINTNTAAESKLADKEGNTTSVTAGGVDIADAQGNRNNIDATGLIIADDEKSNVIDKDGMTVTDADGNNSSISAGGVNVESDKGSSDLTADKLAFTGKDGKDSVAIKAADGTNGPSIDFAKAENGKDGRNGTGKITGLADIDANETDGTVAANKNYVDDKFAEANAGQPFEYYTKEGDEKVIRGRDGKLYKESELANYTFDKDSGEYKAKDGSTGKPTALDSDKVIVKAMPNAKPMAIGNVASGLDATKVGAVKDPAGDKDVAKEITVDTAKELVTGKEGGAKGLNKLDKVSELNKVATIGDLKTVSLAGLDFGANAGDDVHRNLGEKVSIVGNKDVVEKAKAALGLAANQVVDVAALKAEIAKTHSSKNVVTVTDANEIVINIADKPEFKAISVKDDAMPGKTLDLTPETITMVADGNTNKMGADGLEVKDANGNANNIGADGLDITDASGNVNSIGAAGLEISDEAGNNNNISAESINLLGANGKESNLEAGKLVLIKSAGGGDKPEAHIVLEATDKGGKLTGLENRNTSSEGYGSDVSRAATESAVKKNRDDVDNGVVGPIVYTDNKGNRLVKADDGKYYAAKDVENGKAKDKAVEVKNPALSLANANTDRATQNAPVVLNNVAAGELAENSNQAVNGAQLHQTNINIQNNGIRIDNLQNQVNTLDKNMRAGVAQAVAHANLPMNILPGKSTLSLATGNYMGTQAFAVGYSRVSDSGKVSVKFSLGHGGKQTSVGAGIGYSW